MATNWTINGVLAENLFEFGAYSQSILGYLDTNDSRTVTALGNASTLNAGDLEDIVKDYRYIAGGVPVGSVGVLINTKYTDPVTFAYTTKYIDIGSNGAQKGVFAIPPSVILSSSSQTFSTPSPIYNTDGATSSAYSIDFSGRFNDNGYAITSYDFSGWYWLASNAYINTISYTADTTLGTLSNVIFTLDTSAPIGTHTATHVFRCRATNIAGYSTYTDWICTVTFTVTQGPVPQPTPDTLTANGTKNVNEGSSDYFFHSSNWVGRFTTDPNYPVLEYRTNSNTQISGNHISYNSILDTATGYTSQKHTILADAPAGVWSEDTTLTVAARNKYGWSSGAAWRMTSSFNVIAQRPTIVTASTTISFTRSWLENQGIKTLPVYSFDLSTMFSDPLNGSMTYTVELTQTNPDSVYISNQSYNITGSTLTVYMQFDTTTSPPDIQRHEIYEVHVSATNSVGKSNSNVICKCEVFATAISNVGGGGGL